jgi:hypothetical protein
VRRLIGVRRKATIIGILAILLAAATTGNSPAVYGKAVSSVRSFQRNFGDLKKADSMSPIERFVFSLVLSNSKVSAESQGSHVPQTGRT